MGAIEGGYQALVDRLAERIRGLGGKIHTSSPIRHIPASATGRALGVVTEDGLREHDTVVTTQLRPNLQGVLAPELEAQLGADPLRYMGIVCLVARVKKSVSPYYAINITDRRVPITSVVETTHVVEPGGRRGPPDLRAQATCSPRAPTSAARARTSPRSSSGTSRRSSRTSGART